LTFVKLCKDTEIHEANLPYANLPYTDFYEKYGIEPKNKTPYEVIGPEEYKSGHARCVAKCPPKGGV
jgi:hypothetical protein